MVNPATPWVFISYRRADGGHWAVKVISQELESHLGSGSVFFDIGSIKSGKAWPDALEAALKSCTALLVLITPSWSQERIYDEHDWVRREIRTALKRNIVVIPVLLDAAQLPRPEDLPSDISAITATQALYIESRSEEAFKVTTQIAAKRITELSRCKIIFTRPEAPSLVAYEWKLFIDGELKSALNGAERETHLYYSSGIHSFRGMWYHRSYNLGRDRAFDQGHGGETDNVAIALRPGEYIITLRSNFEGFSSWQTIKKLALGGKESRELVYSYREP